jgi:hypothetical protein
LQLRIELNELQSDAAAIGSRKNFDAMLTVLDDKRGLLYFSTQHFKRS